MELVETVTRFNDTSLNTPAVDLYVMPAEKHLNTCYQLKQVNGESDIVFTDDPQDILDYVEAERARLDAIEKHVKPFVALHKGIGEPCKSKST